MLKLVEFSLISILACFALKKKNILTTLLTLEIFMILIIVSIIIKGFDIFISLMAICIGVCEGAVGLSALIRMTRIKRYKLRA